MSVKVKWFGNRAKEISAEGAVLALFRAAEFLLERANETVPIEEAILKGSGDTDVDGSAFVATVFYNTPYAVAQHEDMTYQHPHGRAKWLQLTMQEQQGAIKEIFAEALRDEFRRGPL